MDRSAKPQVSSEAFFALDLRVGRIRRVEPFPEARRPAWKVEVDFGPLGTLRSSAQVVHYPAEELVDRLVVGAVNLGSKRIAGFKSEFLLLGAIGEDGVVRLLRVEDDANPGDPVA